MKLDYKAERDGIVVLDVLVNNFELSRRRISRLKREDAIKVNSKTVHTNYILNNGDILAVTINSSINAEIIPQKIEIDIIYEDEYFCIVNKNPYITIHPCRGYLDNTLANALLYHWKQNNEDASFHAVSRIDKDTSGLVVIAKNGYIHKNMQEYFFKNSIHRKYIALAEGIIETQSGTIDKPIGILNEGSILRGITEKGQKAVTNFKVIKTYQNSTLVELELITGRTHQIRVHMKSIGHPLIGDKLYNDLLENTTLIKRQALHAYRIAFKHPITNENLDFEIGLPKDIRDIIKFL
jgi:23S rRNA pseudouridine1911/1915/1917 synthase